MRIAGAAMLVWLASVPVRASIIDVTEWTTVRVDPGNTLSFEISGSSYAANAPLYGASARPTRIEFTLVTAEGTGGLFTAILETAGASVVLAIPGPLSFVPGTFHGAAYDGPISALTAWRDLSDLESEALFAGGTAILTLQNQGSETVLGLSPYTLPHVLLVTLSGGAFSVGARVGTVLLDPPDAPLTAAPEPNSGVLLLAGGGLLCLISAALQRIERRRVEVLVDTGNWAHDRKVTKDQAALRSCDLGSQKS
jgi:hypothetical protein